METFLLLNGFQIASEIEEQEKIILELAAGELDRETFTRWLREHVQHLA